ATRVHAAEVCGQPRRPRRRAVRTGRRRAAGRAVHAPYSAAPEQSLADVLQTMSDGRFVVRGTARGTPVGPFFGVDPATGKSCEIMSIDILTLEGGLITHVYHLEDWTGAVAQLTAE
ncbi:MAG: ester cyclase, partial [Pseudomonadota bacterium]